MADQGFGSATEQVSFEASGPGTPSPDDREFTVRGFEIVKDGLFGKLLFKHHGRWRGRKQLACGFHRSMKPPFNYLTELGFLPSVFSVF